MYLIVVTHITEKKNWYKDYVNKIIALLSLLGKINYLLKWYTCNAMQYKFQSPVQTNDYNSFWDSSILKTYFP